MIFDRLYLDTRYINDNRVGISHKRDFIIRFR